MDGMREKYGPRDGNGRYTVRPGVGLGATYDPDSHPVVMTVKLLGDGTMAESKGLARRKAIRRDVALTILDEILPVRQRGKRTASFLEERGCSSR